MATTGRISHLSPRLLGSTALVTLGVVLAGAVRAEVTTDGSLGPRVTLGGPNVGIGPELGQTRGGNLFHSFQRFDVERGGRVTFTGPGGIRNIVGRVTGGQRSSIDGTLASDIQGANLYLLNPAGILFGRNARLDVKGSFHASTADQLNFADGAVFSVLDTAGSTLTVAEPQSFGFLGNHVGRLEVSGSTLLVPAGETLDLAAGDIGITGATLSNQVDLFTPGTSSLTVAAQSGAGTVALDPSTPAVARDGPIAITAAGDGTPSTLLVTGPAGGRIRIEGGAIVLDGGNVAAVNLGLADDSGGVDLAAQSLSVRTRPTADGQAGGVLTTTLGMGRAGPVEITATDIDMLGGSLASTPVGAGGGGPVTISSDRLTMDGGTIGVPILPLPGAGASATTMVEAREALTLRNGASITSTTFGDGAAGPMTIKSDGTIELGAGGQISASTVGGGSGGTVTVSADTITIDGGTRAGTASTPSGILATAGSGSTGSAGTIAVDAAAITLTGGGQIFAGTFGQGDGGSVAIDADTLVVRGRFVDGTFFFPSGVLATAEFGSAGDAGDIRVDAARIEVGSGGQIATNTRSSGDGGGITLSAGQIALTEGAQIIGSTFAQGRGGSIVIDADALSARGRFFDGSQFIPSGVLANAETGSSGDAGGVTVRADRIDLANRGRISTRADGTGMGGPISVTVDTMLVDGASESPVPQPTGLLADTTGDGDAGSIELAATAVTLRNGGQISGTTSGSGNGGTVTVEAGTLAIDGGFSAGTDSIPSGILATARPGSTGSAGNLTVQAPAIELTGGGQIFAGTFGPGNGGAVQIAADSLLVAGGFLSDGFSFPSAVTAGADLGSSGDAGGVQVSARVIDLRDGGSISGSTRNLGDGGDVTVTADQVTIGGTAVLAGRPLVAGIRASAADGAAGSAGEVNLRTEQLTVTPGGEVASSTDGTGNAGRVLVAASGTVDVNGGSIETNSRASGAAGDVVVRAQRVQVRGDGLIGSSGTGAGPAGDVRIRAGRLEVQNASIRTEGQGAEGGRIAVAADDRIYLRRADVTSNGIQPQAGASVITLAAPQIVLNASTVTSLTGDGRPLTGSGEASLLGDVTVISADSLVAGSSSVVISGLQTNLGSDLQLAPGTFLDASRLLRASCDATGAGPRSSFTRGGRGGLPPSPDRPLPSVGAVPSGAGGTATAGPVLLDACAGTLVRGANS
jgi:filamentous hemagglutinin family protein